MKNNNKPQKSVAWLGIEPGTYTIEARVLTTDISTGSRIICEFGIGQYKIIRIKLHIIRKNN